MDRCIYLGKDIYASDVYKEYSNEKEIRFLSLNKKLICPGCNSIVIYKHGDKKGPHFSHRLRTKGCSYDDYYKIRHTSIYTELKNSLLYKLRQIYPKCIIQKDSKIEGIWVDFLLDDLNQKVIIELVDNYDSYNYIERKYCELMNKGVKVLWLIIDNNKKIIKESDLAFVKRKQLNEGFGILFLLNPINFELKICKAYKSKLDNSSSVFEKIYQFEKFNIFESYNYIKEFQKEYENFILHVEKENKLYNKERLDDRIAHRRKYNNPPKGYISYNISDLEKLFINIVVSKMDIYKSYIINSIMNYPESELNFKYIYNRAQNDENYMLSKHEYIALLDEIANLTILSVQQAEK